MLWHESSWPKLARTDKNTPVVVPLGSCEQHGRHLPVFVDTLQVTEIARRVESALDDQILLLPTLWLGSSHHHRDYAGTVSVPPLLYAQIIQEICRSLMRCGFKRILFLNGHGGNSVPAADALSDLVARDDQADSTYLALSSWWELGRESIRSSAEGFGQPMISHACEFETSLMLVLRQDLVELDKLVQLSKALTTDWYDSEDDGLNRVHVFRRFHRLTASGAMGIPQHATREKGIAILEGVCNDIIEFLRNFAQWPELPVIGPE